MKKIILFLFAVGCLSTRLDAQNLSLSKFLPHEAGSGYRINDMEYMSNGNLVAVGKFTTWSPTYQSGIMDAATGASAGFIVVYDVSGNVVWSHVFDGTGEDAVSGIAIDESDNIYLTGFIESTTSVNFGGAFLLPATGNQNDGFIARYTPSGTLNYAVLFGGNGRDKPSAIALNSGFLYVGGMFNNTTDLDPGAGIASFTSAGSPGNMDYFIGKYNASNGAYLAGYTHGEDNATTNGYEETVFGISIDGSDVYSLVRHFLSPSISTAFGNGVTIGNSTSINVLLKLNTDLLPIAATDFGVQEADYKFLEFHQGKCVVLGKDYNNERLLVNEINPNLTINNTLQSGPITWSYSFEPTGFSIGGDNLYLSGWTSATIDLNGSTMPVTVNSEPRVAFLAKINHASAQFNYEWVEQFGQAPAYIYSNGQASNATKLAFGGIVNSNQLNFDPNPTTAIDGVNAHGSTSGFTYAPFFSEYNTCVAPLITSTADDASACQGGEVTLTATGASPIEWYDAPMGGSLINTGSSTTLTVVGSGNVYMENVCSATRIEVPYTLVSPAAPSIYGANSSLCSGTLQSMVATNVASYLDTYSWSGGGTDGNATISANASGTSDFTLTFTASNPTKNCSVTVSALIDVLPSEPLQADLSPLCLTSGDEQGILNFSVNTTVTSPNYTNFTWTSPALSGGPYTGGILSFSGSPNGVGYVICSSVDDLSGCFTSDTVEVTFDTIPVHTYVLSCTEAMVGEPLLANESISWLDNESNAGNASVFTLDPAATQLQMQIVNDNCVFTMSIVYEIPSANETTITTSGADIQVVESNNNFSYQWIECLNGDPIANEENPSFTPSSEGNYALVIDNGQGCVDTSNCIMSTVGLSEWTDEKLAVYPNPASIFIQIDIPIAERIELRDVNGKVMQLISNYQGQEIFVDELAKGFYFVVIHHQGNVAVEKLIVE